MAGKITRCIATSVHMDGVLGKGSWFILVDGITEKLNGYHNELKNAPNILANWESYQ